MIRLTKIQCIIWIKNGHQQVDDNSTTKRNAVPQPHMAAEPKHNWLHCGKNTFNEDFFNQYFFFSCSKKHAITKGIK